MSSEKLSRVSMHFQSDDAAKFFFSFGLLFVSSLFLVPRVAASMYPLLSMNKTLLLIKKNNLKTHEIESHLCI